jgi:hypothetical protein
VANIEFVEIDEMLPKRALRQSRRRQIQEEYEGYIRSLEPGQAGKVTLEKGEKMSLIRDRLRSAASRLERPIQLRRKGGTLYFRLKEPEVSAVPVSVLAAAEVPPEPAPPTEIKSGRRRRSSA